jgi:hypothetical protein
MTPAPSLASVAVTSRVTGTVEAYQRCGCSDRPARRGRGRGRPVPARCEAALQGGHVAAGLVEGRLHLVAYALGAGVIGMRFLDSEVPDLLGGPDDSVTLLFTCVAVPENASKPVVVLATRLSG